jgi:hypothetical protein
LPCSGEKYHCFTNQTFHALLHECGHDKECVIHKGADYTNKTNKNLLVKSPGPGILNNCFSEFKWELSPNGQECWNRAQEAIANQGAVTKCTDKCCGSNTYSKPVCNNGGKEIPPPSSSSSHQKEDTSSSSSSSSSSSPYAEPSDRYWAASGAGIVLFSDQDAETQFNIIRIHTPLLWHHGHGRLAQNCDLW